MKKLTAALFALGLWLCGRQAMAAPDKVLEYWPKQPAEFSFPSKVYFASKNITSAWQSLQEDDQNAQLAQGSDLIMDFGADVGGFFEFKIKVTKPARIQLNYSEAGKFAKSGAGIMGISSSTRKLLQRNYTVENSGWFTDPVLMGGARYVRIRVEKGALELDAVRCRNTALQCDPLNSGWFLSSDEVLNKSWYASYYTLCLDTIHSNQGAKSGREKIGEGEWVIVDGAKRDRLIWSGDMGIAGPLTFVSSGRYDIVRNTLLSLAHWQYPSGIYPACSRAELGNVAASRFLEYSIWQVINSHDYYFYSGDQAFLKEIYPGMVKAMEYHHSKTNNDGIILQSPLSDGWNYSFSIFRSGPVAFVNALYFISLQDAAKMAVIMKDFGQAQLFLARADKVQENFNRYFWDKNVLAYRDVYLDVNHHALDGNALAILSGLADKEKTDDVIDFMNKHLALKWGDRQFDYPYHFPQKIPLVSSHNARNVMAFTNAFDAMARYVAGRDDQAVDLIRRCWGNMAAKDPNFTTWEWVGRDGNPDSPVTSLAHAWSAGAAFILSERVLGIRPLEAGYASYLIEPHVSGLSWAQGMVPSPRGPVSVSWKDSADKFEMELNLPEGRGPRVSLSKPGENFRVTMNGEVIFDQGKNIENPGVEGAYFDQRSISCELKQGGTYKFVMDKSGGSEK